MHPARHIQLLSLCIFATLSLIGCGQTGRLYLPDEPRQQLPPQTNEAASGTEADSDAEPRKKRPGTDDVPATDAQTPISPPDPDRPADPAPETPSR